MKACKGRRGVLREYEENQEEKRIKSNMWAYRGLCEFMKYVEFIRYMKYVAAVPPPYLKER